MEKSKLKFKDWLEKRIPLWGQEEWVTVYSSDEEVLDCDGGTYSAIVPLEIAQETLKEYSWDLCKGDGFPRIINDITGEYCRIPKNGIEALVFLRIFNGRKSSYLELSQEFVLYFDLCREVAGEMERFIAFDNNGDEEVVAEINQKKAVTRVKLKFLKEFLFVKKAYLALFFDLRRYDSKTLEELNVDPKNSTTKKPLMTYRCYLGPDESSNKDRKTYAMIMGKKLIPPPDKKFNAIDKQDKCIDFIVGVDQNGKPKSFTCDKNILHKRNAPPYFLTAIFFKREVLEKYYNNPDKYEVQDACIIREGFWCLRADNSHDEYVVVFLGDLSSIPTQEQLYWRQFNISASDSSISKTCYDRMFMVKFRESDQTDLFFKSQFELFNKKWEEKYGWKLWKDLNDEDQHNLSSLRIPLHKNSQREFDELVGALTKVFVDSLNENAIKKYLSDNGIELPQNVKGIDKFEALMNFLGVTSREMIKFFRDFQALRSRGVAHRKGPKYEKIKKEFGIGEKTLKEVFENKLLLGCIRTMNTLDSYLSLGVKSEML